MSSTRALLGQASSIGSKAAGAVWLIAIAAAIVAAAAPPPWIQLALAGVAVGSVLLFRGNVRSTKPFWWGVAAAGVFVLIRLAYRVLFGGYSGAPSGEHVLWTLPQVTLGGPFAGIHLFGVTTAEALLATVSQALPFAVMFVLFGAANTLADPRDLLERAPAKLSALAWSTSIGLSVFPAVIRSAQRLRVARALRSDRRAAALVVPLLEQTIEQAERLGLSLAARGFGTKRVQPLNAGSLNPVGLSLTNVSAWIAGEQILYSVTLDAAPASITVVVGRTGSGKSTLLQAMRGVFEETTGGALGGSVSIGDEPVNVQSHIALTLQRPEESFVATTVRKEIEFGAVQRGTCTPDTAQKFAQRLKIEHLLDRPIEALSAGEAALVALAAAVVTEPAVLLLDEPIADLDADAAQRVIEMVRTLRDELGMTIVIAEHRPESLVGLADRAWEISDGCCTEVPVNTLAAPTSTASDSQLHRASRIVPVGPEVTLCTDLTVAKNGTEVLHSVTLSIHASAVTALIGPNGCGKTTLLEHLALTRGRPNDGIVMVGHNVDDMLFARTIAEECRVNDRILRIPAGSTEASIRRFLPDLGTLDRHPRDCSAGTRVVLALALQLARSSCVLLLDEPTRGLDAHARAELGIALGRAAAAGNAVLVATHDEAFARQFAQYTVRMRDGRILPSQVLDTDPLPSEVAS